MRWVLPMVLLAMLATAAAGLAARQVYAEPEPAAPPAVVPTVGEVPAAEQPGPGIVNATAEATAHPLFDTVKPLLQTYFDAINARRYDLWRGVVTERRANNQPERDWQADYRSTKDGTIAVWRIETGPANSARVLLSFTSVQDLRNAPLELPERCIHWWIVFPLAVEGGTWKLDAGPTGSAPQHEKC